MCNGLFTSFNLRKLLVLLNSIEFVCNPCKCYQFTEKEMCFFIRLKGCINWANEMKLLLLVCVFY